jgi:hypothetical protein
MALSVAHARWCWTLPREVDVVEWRWWCLTMHGDGDAVGNC